MGMLIAVATGGALGSLARYGLTIACEELLGRSFPYGIFIANIVGSLAIGICFVLLVERALVSEVWRSLAMVGFLGGFTTFSTFSLQSIGLIQEGRVVAAFVYIVGSVLISIIAAWFGIQIARLLSS